MFLTLIEVHRLAISWQIRWVNCRIHHLALEEHIQHLVNKDNVRSLNTVMEQKHTAIDRLHGSSLRLSPVIRMRGYC